MKWTILILVSLLVYCTGREPFKPVSKALPFVVYFTSRYRGICVGTLAARTVVLTAAACVLNPYLMEYDTRPINVIAGSTYRHPRRGIRVQVTHILIPRLPEEFTHRTYLLEKSAAVMLMKRRVPDIIAEVPLRPLYIDWMGEEALTLQEECLIPGWHFFYRGDKIFPVKKFLLQRNIRVQFMNIVKMHEWCDPLHLRLSKLLANIGFQGAMEKSSMICIKDPDATAQPCHGMYGAPLICGGRAVGALLAPNAQWTNCTGFTNIIHLFSSLYLREFFECVSSLFDTECHVSWTQMKKAIYDENPDAHDYIPSLYDRLVAKRDSESSTEEQ